ncbi:phosphomevalonate kinase [Virgibacillus salexigens]|uniref:phosphomevalonate kinase n=1 Tax=Virgibacillus salexigens TaxID=61016 RepID=UPI001F2A0EAF|nr:phosphomevalonate kinase [Virgibacillus salexigens]
MLQQTPMTIKVPGKLMVAGEFAVLQPNNHLVVMAVDRYVYATIQPTETNEISLLDFQLEQLEWEFTNGRVKIDCDDIRTSFVEEAMTIAIKYLKEQRILIKPFRLTIKSELDDTSGVKYGLGSSAAVVTSVITAILHQSLPYRPSARLIFQLAAISHVVTQGNGSGADVAASSHGGFLNYSSFQADWLRHAYQNALSLSDVVNQNWKYLSLQRVQLPENIHMCIGWTGKPASTAKLVDEILKLKTDNLSHFNQFLLESEQAVTKILNGMKENDASLFLSGITENRHALAKVGRYANVDIETSLLSKLCDLAEAYGGAGKPSGAGGGDCGIAFMPSKQQADQLIKAWEEVGIKPLSLKANPFGARKVEV